MPTTILRAGSLVAVGAVLFGAMTAQAGIDGTLTISAFDPVSQQMGSVEFTLDPVAPGEWNYTGDGPVEITAPDNSVLATVNPDLAAISAQFGRTFTQQELDLHSTGTSITMMQDPTIIENFNVFAGASAVIITIDSALLDIVPDFVNATASASASFAATDVDGNGVTLNGMALGSTGTDRVFRAAYNGFAGDGFGTTFAEFFDELNAGPLGTDNPPAQDLDGPIALAQDMSQSIRFSLTAFDLASGVTNYTIVPEPGSIMLLALGLTLLRRR